VGSYIGVTYHLALFFRSFAPAQPLVNVAPNRPATLR
jgi:hypothetical protein